ncbi:pyridoxamine 5'-phosphate oxidase family protein [Edaphobacter albus]|uniref:pyridoxamine 5'-phosphate oxidase family protein n=1 Tax=Edaphobacter sp. 4G125 TaxID=2763071 RepID=UPI001648F79C|nr:pyridoxamine 5'-phosphate oxidase family protein [Edaphobacter sp. 4G125]QNI37756.1 pyridoxamine 5'-phosphate oxidase family protein [Edaphobacter sp. 4G125]
MGRRFAQIAFTPHVKEEQVRQGSYLQYQRAEQNGRADHLLTEHESEFIQSRDSFYLATVSETGWPYVQHRGGRPGFLHVLDEHTLGFADYRGNRQYVSLGNIKHEDRVALFLMDYPSRSRLKILGHAVVHEGEAARSYIDVLSSPQDRNLIERVILIQIEAFDWNCQQHITPRYTEEQILNLMDPVRQRLAALETENKRLRQKVEMLSQASIPQVT